MVFSKIWVEVQTRFYVSLAISIFLVLSLIITFPLSGILLSYIKDDMSAQDFALLQQYAKDYRLFMDHAWFDEVGLMNLFAIVLTLGGVMTERGRRSILLTLSLPVSRKSWILGQGSLSALLLFLIASVCSVLIVAGGVGMGKTFPLLRAMGGTLLMVVGSLPWIAITLLVTALTQDRLKAAVFSFLLCFLISPLQSFSPVAVWMPEAIMQILQSAPFPWQSLLSISLATAICWFAAIRIFENRDF